MKNLMMRFWFGRSEATRAVAMVLVLTVGLAVWWGGNLAQLRLI